MVRIQARELTLKNGRRALVRPAEPGDAAALLAYVRALLPEPGHFLWTPEEFACTERQEREILKKASESEEQCFLVVEARGDMVGAPTFARGSRKRTSHVGSFGMSLRRDRRDQGLGRGFLGVLVDWARGRPGPRKLELSVFSTNARALAL